MDGICFNLIRQRATLDTELVSHHSVGMIIWRVHDAWVIGRRSPQGSCSQVVAPRPTVGGHRRTSADDGRIIETCELTPPTDAGRRSRTLADAPPEIAS
jgi:hypothetical protein